MLSPDEGSQHLDKIRALKERVKKLGENGTDVSKVNKILQNLESSLSTVEEQEKIEVAFTKFENLISKMETGGAKTKRKRSVKKIVKKPISPPQEEKPAAPTPEDDQKEPETPPEEPPEPIPDQSPQEPETPPEEPSEPIPDQAEQEPETPPEEPPQEPELPPEEPPEKKEEPQAKEPEPSPPKKFDTKTASKEIKNIDSLVGEIVELGGDPAPIQPHIEALKQAKGSKDTPNFEIYLKTSKDWLVQYLVPLRKTRIETILTSLNSRIADFTKVDEEARVKAIQQAMEKLLIGFEDADLKALAKTQKDVEGIQRKMEKKFNTLTEDLTKLVNESCEVVESVLGEISDDVDTRTLSEELKEVKEHLFNGEFIEARVKGQELLVKAVAERDSKELKKLNSLLLSIEPLMDKIEEIEGKDSDIFRSLDDERQSLIDRSKRDVKDALNMMEQLVDRTSTAVADIEEDHLKKLEETIITAQTEAEELKDTLNVDPILKILGKAQEMLVEGQADKAQIMIDKAEDIFSKMKGKRASEVALFRINDLKERKEVLNKKGIDVSPLDEPIGMAAKAVQAGDMESFEKIMSTIDERLLFMRNEELKVDYQKALIKIINGLKEIREDGQDVSDLDAEVEKFKALYMERKYEEAITAADSVMDRMSGRKLYKVIDERKRIVDETLKEAEGLLVDVEGPSKKLSSADQFIQEKDYEKALDLLIEAQVELEERMTQRTFSLVENEIRDLVSECVKYSVDPGDYEGIIANAYAMADEEKFREAMEHLSRFREKLSRKVMVHKVKDLMTRMTQLIKQGRSFGVDISPFKASMTKARVLMDAGDIDASYQLISRQVDTLDTTITNKRSMVARMDKLRGNLLAQEGKLSRLERTGVSVDEFRLRVDRVKQLIEESDHEEAEKELVQMDQDINEMLIAKPEQLRKEMVTTIMDEQETRPLSIDRLAPVEKPKLAEKMVDPDRARNELFTLIPKIKVEITRLHSKGIDTDEYKRDIARIQNLVIKRQYVEAHHLGKDCFKRMTN